MNFLTRKLNLRVYELMTSRSTKKGVKTLVRPIREKIVKEEVVSLKSSIEITNVFIILSKHLGFS